MSEAPEKIWLCTENTQWSLFENGEEGDIQYIRADIVDELVKALEECMKFNGCSFDEEPIEALIAKLKIDMSTKS